MRGIGVNISGPPAKGLAELNYHTRDEQKEVRDGVAGVGQGLSEEDESRINEDAENVKCGPVELVRAQAQVIPQRQQQQSQGPVVQWEQFLPLRSLKVLLVENDDSTRHVVSALLRNCSYEVMAVSNGLEAWKILDDLTNHIDLVLTEVVMPCLSGVGLLSKIKSHKTCDNIPVIMMSSNDSMGIVFKCLSKGAVDFLVKPVRKNELKNLWQHVWRKCHSSSGSGSGSESGIRTKKYRRSKSGEGSDNSGSNDEDDNESVDLTVKNGSDNGSGTQSSWSKRVVEVNSPQRMSPWNELADPPDSSCVQVMHSRPEAFGNNGVHRTATRECHKADAELDGVAMGKDLEIGVRRNPDLQLEDLSKKVLTCVKPTNKDKLFDLNSKKDGYKVGNRRLELNSETENSKKNKAADLIGGIASSSNHQMKHVATEALNDLSKVINIKDKAIYNTKELPSLELSLKRERDVGDTRTTVQERNVLRHSDLSAFSRYNTSSNTNPTPTGNVGSCSPLDNNSSEVAKTESMLKSNGTPNQRSNGSSNNDMGSTTNNVFTKPEAFTDKPNPISTVNIRSSSAFQPVQQGHTPSLQPEISGKGDAAASQAMHQQVQVQHHHHHYHHHHHHVHNMQQKQQLTNHDDDMSLQNMVASASHCGPSNVLTGQMEGNAANYSLNGSTSGSNKRSSGENGSSGQNGSSNAAIAEGTHVASDNAVAGKCGADDGSASGSRSGVDQNRLSQREAALNKFRQKRKDRCFEKKVRYQSRKKLAEQKPRVRGQFVRQAVNGDNKKDANS